MRLVRRKTQTLTASFGFFGSVTITDVKHIHAIMRGANLKVTWAEFSILSWAVFVTIVIALHGQEWPHLELQTYLAQVLFY